MFRDRLLTYCFLASILINAVFVLLVGNSRIFATEDVVNTLRAREITDYKPPVPERPRPKPKTPPPPPKPEPRPEPKPRQAPPQPRQVVRQPQPRPRVNIRQPVRSSRPARNEQTRSSAPQVGGDPGPVAPTPTGSGSTRGQIASNISGGETGFQSDTQDPAPGPIVRTPAPPPPPAAALPPPPPIPVPTPAPPPPQPVPTPPAPEPPPPANREAERQTPEPIGGAPRLRLTSGADVSSLASATIVIACVVDESGVPKHIRVQQGSGDGAIDQAAVAAIRAKRFRPAVQDGLAREAPYVFRFRIR